MNDNKIQIIKDDEIDIRAFFQVLWNDRKRIMQITAIVILIGVFYALLATPLYKSTISIYPSGGGEISQMAEIKSMASAFGIGSSMAQNSLNIGDIISSRSLQKKLIYYKWNSENFDVPVNLITYWEIDDITKFNISFNPIQWVKSFKRLLGSMPDVNPYLDYKFEMAAIGELSERIEMRQTKTGLYIISVWMEEKDLAAEIANEIYNILVEFITVSHVNKARMNREFIQERLKDIDIELNNAEENLKKFREENRSITESPQLELILGRLMRDVELQTQLYITLLEQLELAKIKELDESPTLTVLDKATPPLKKDKPKNKILVISFSVIGILLGIITSLINHYRKRTPS